MAPTDQGVPITRARFNPPAHAGRDHTATTRRCHRGCFNPRAHAGRDPPPARHLPQGGQVSIHAPTRGATRSCTPRAAKRRSFNPRAHAGRDASTCCVSEPPMPFQSTRPRGARRSRSSMILPAEPFQSTRPRGARRAQARHRGLQRIVSIHAPTRGATVAEVGDGAAGAVSIHAPTRGATADAAPTLPCVAWFQSTRPRGARQVGRKADHARLVVSIHAPTRGATHRLRVLPARLCVSIHAPTRGATRSR